MLPKKEKMTGSKRFVITIWGDRELVRYEADRVRVEKYDGRPGSKILASEWLHRALVYFFQEHPEAMKYIPVYIEDDPL